MFIELVFMDKKLVELKEWLSDEISELEMLVMNTVMGSKLNVRAEAKIEAYESILSDLNG
jgi:hypothetical protein